MPSQFQRNAGTCTIPSNRGASAKKEKVSVRPEKTVEAMLVEFLYLLPNTNPARLSNRVMNSNEINKPMGCGRMGNNDISLSEFNP